MTRSEKNKDKTVLKGINDWDNIYQALDSL